MRGTLVSSETCEHGTPPEYVEMGRDLIGAIDLDPFSSSYWNTYLVKATRFYDERDNGFDQPWYGRMFVNHPGVARSGNCRRSWDKLISGWMGGQIETAVWVGFNLNQLSDLQGAAHHPLQLCNLFPRERICFMVRNGGSPPVRSNQPMHGNYITLLPTRKSASQAREQISKFASYGESLTIGGAVTRPI